MNLARVLRLLVRVGTGLSFSCFSEDVAGTFDGKTSSSKVCQRMFGGLLIMLKTANLRIGERLREKGVWGDR